MAMIKMNVELKTMKAMEEMMTGAVRECVTYLASEYSFDAEEALAKVSISCETKKKSTRAKKEPKEKKTKFVKPAMPLPFCNVVMEGRCGGICLNNRLYTQCLKPAGENGLCAACNKQAAANEHGKPNYGLICDRVDNAEWTDPKGKAPVRFATVMLKQSIEKDAAVEEAAKFGWTIDEIQFEVEEKKPKKTAKRGRPAKTKSVETGGAADDLIAQLVAQAQQEQGGADEDEDESKAYEPEVVVAEEPAVVEQPKPVKKPKKTAEEKEAEKQAKLKAKEEEKATKLAAKEAEKQAKLQAKEAEKQAKLQAKADAKAAKEAEKKAAAEKKVAEKKAKEQVKAKVEVLEKELVDVATKTAEEIVQEMGGLEVNDGELQEEEDVNDGELQEEEDMEEEEVEEEESTEVVKFDVNGTTYLKDNEDVLYDMETQEPVGVWNKETKQIDEIDVDSDEEEDLE